VNVLDEVLPSAAELVNQPKWSAAFLARLADDRHAPRMADDAGNVPERHTERLH
jgi:hypothetical protein